MLHFFKRSAASVQSANAGKIRGFFDESGIWSYKDENGNVVDSRGLGYSGVTSTSTIASAVGDRTFITNKAVGVSGNGFSVGDRVRVKSASAAGYYVEGVIKSYITTTAVVTVDIVKGNVAGISDWVFGLTGETGTGIGYSGVTSGTTFTPARVTQAMICGVNLANFAYIVGQRVQFIDSGNSANWFRGNITAISGQTMTVAIDDITATPSSSSSWKVTVSGDSGYGYAGLTSATSNTPSLASKTFTVNIDKSNTAFAVGQRVRAASAANPTTNFIEGIITSYTGTTLVLNADFIGTAPLAATNWIFSVAGSIPGSTVSVTVNFTDNSHVQYVTVNDANVSASKIPAIRGYLLSTTPLTDPINLYDVAIVSVSTSSFIIRVTVFDMNGSQIEQMPLPSITVLYQV